MFINRFQERIFSISLGAAEAIENSILAFDKYSSCSISLRMRNMIVSRGLSNGVEMLEIDCHLTKDLQAVVHHDAILNRTTGQLGHIRDVEYNVGGKCLAIKETLLSSLEITKD